jgi:hypothetical protein
MTPESRNTEIRDVHYYATTRKTYSCGNEYVSNNRLISIAMQRRCKHTFQIVERLFFFAWFVKVAIKKSLVEKNLPGHELGNRGI